MKKLSYIVLLLLSSFLIYSCREEVAVYDGEPLLHFNEKTAGEVIIASGDVQKDIVITYGTIAAVNGSHQVKLVVDTEKSNTVEGKDYIIINNGTDELTTGERTGSFTVRVLESGASATPKTTVFKLQSATVKNAVFNQEYTLVTSLKCPIEVFVGNTQFDYAGWWNGTGTFEIVHSTTEANTLLIKDFGNVGTDLKVKYDPETFVVTIPDQYSGYSTSQGQIWAKPSTDATQVSSLSTCSRTMKLYINWYIPGVGSYGNKLEDFKGK